MLSILAAIFWLVLIGALVVAVICHFKFILKLIIAVVLVLLALTLIFNPGTIGKMGMLLFGVACLIVGIGWLKAIARWK